MGKKLVVCTVIVSIVVCLVVSNFGFTQLLHDEKQSHQLIDQYDTTYNDISVDANLQHNNQYITNLYYNLVTDFYEYGWGQSFHFGIRYKGESFEQSIRRQEFFLASKLQLKRGMKVLDIGSGVGGPARSIAAFTGAEIHTVNLNEYQVKRCKQLTPSEMKKLVYCHFGDYTNLENFQNESFDAVYAFESTVHVEDRSKPFGQAFRVLKKGGIFATFELVMTSKYDPQNLTHNQVKRALEHGNGLPNMLLKKQSYEYMLDAGFEILEDFDLDQASQEMYGNLYVPWYKPLQPEWSLEGFKSTPLGRYLTQVMLRVFETLRIAPEGSLKVAQMLERGAYGIERGGALGIFTPMYLIVGRKN